jgi:hypothetical protein
MALKDALVATCCSSATTADAALADISATQMPAHPSLASNKQVARPIPEPPPVTKAKPVMPRGCAWAVVVAMSNLLLNLSPDVDVDFVVSDLDLYNGFCRKI